MAWSLCEHCNNQGKRPDGVPPDRNIIQVVQQADPKSIRQALTEEDSSINS